MHTTKVTGKVVNVSRWVANADGEWVCELCGGGKHQWNENSGKPQPIQCPDCDAIMVDKGAIGGK